MKKAKFKIVLLALIALAGLGAVVGGSFGAYNSQDYQKGVVRNRDNETIRFTSNYLQACTATDETQYVGKTKLFNGDIAENQLVSLELEIYNYVYGNQSLVSERDILYTLEVKLSGENLKTNQYTITSSSGEKESFSSDTYKKSGQLLVGRTANSNKYTIGIPASDLNNVRLIITAKPENSVTNGRFLAAVIAPCTAITVDEFSCKGSFLDSKTISPTSYDAFNYEVSVSGSRAKVTVSWDPSIVEMDQYFLEKLKARDASDHIQGTGTSSSAPYIYDSETGSLIFIMDPGDGTSDYLIPFYLINKSKIPNDWAEMEKIVSVSAEKN